MVAVSCLAEGRIKWARQALDYADMEDPPATWPEGSPPDRFIRGETVSRPGILPKACARAYLAVLPLFGRAARAWYAQRNPRQLPFRLLTEEEAATKVMVSPDLLRRWIGDGRVPYVTLPDGQVRLPTPALEDAVAGDHALTMERLNQPVMR